MIKLLKLIGFAILCFFFVLWIKSIENPFLPALLFCIAAIAFIISAIKK